MKIRMGFISNSSTASFVVKTRPTKWDLLWDKIPVLGENGELTKREPTDFFVLPKKKVALLKRMGFVPTKEENPFDVRFQREGGRFVPECRYNTLLKYYIVCNEMAILQFLVANNIPFKASVHYEDYLYSYDADGEYVYILHNFGLSHWQRPEDVFDKAETYAVESEPKRRVKVKTFLKDYDEKEAMLLTIGEEK